jgi:6-phosphogluconolactonase/glucosamine-6-phosphate isomerase/deaminase
MDAGAADPGAAARSYAARLPDHFDLVHLGIGDDGHAASWLPGTGEDRYREAVTLTAAYRGHRRMTLSPTVVRAARGVLFLVSGEGKRDAFDALLHGRPIPASWALGGPDVTVLTDLPEPADQPPV